MKKKTNKKNERRKQPLQDELTGQFGQAIPQ
jgi:hypothetical protein